MLMSKSCKPLYPGLFLLGAATAFLVFAAPQTCAAALRQGLSLCGGPLLVSLFPFLVVSALIMRSGAGEVLGVLLWPVVRCIGLRSRSGLAPLYHMRPILIVGRNLNAHQAGSGVRRVYGEHFDIGVFLNFSEDHISPKEHASMEEYLQCKLQLLENSGRAVICRETAQFDRVYDTARRCCRAVMLVGMDRDDCDLTVRQVEKLTHGFRFFVQERGSEALHPYHLAMDGDFNIENALAAIGVGRMLGAEHEQMAAALDALEVPGRMNRYEGGGVHVLVDCMHNRASSQALLTDLKRDYPGAPITVVTGIAGGRSPQRIQGMGEMCGKYADRIFFTTDNPDFDDPADIAGRLAHAAAQSGPARVTIQLDRTRAVEQAILEAPEGAVIVLAGKGNDAIQRVRGGYVHYDSDPVVAQRALALREKQRT